MTSPLLPAVSVVVPVYDCIDTLEECLDSLVAQTLRPLEVIVVNDGSPGDEQPIIDEYARRHPDLIVPLLKENGGLADARNYGVARARGGYIGFVDSDDYVEPEMFASLYKAASTLDCDIAIGKYVHHTLDGRASQQGHLDRAEDEVFPGWEFLLTERSMVVWNKIYRRELALRFPQPQRWFEDVAWTPVVMTHAPRVCFVDRTFYHYVRRVGSIASSHDDPRTLEGIGSLDYALAHAAPEHRDKVAFMAVRRLLFESKVRPAYADRYIGAIRDLRKDLIDNDFVANDVWLWDSARTYLTDDFPIIPKQIVYGDFGSRPMSALRAQCVDSWSVHLFYGDGTVDAIDEESIEIDDNPTMRILHDQKRFDELNQYAALRAVIDRGGIALDSRLMARGFIAPCLMNGAIFAFSSPNRIGSNVLGGIPGHPILQLIAEHFEASVEKGETESEFDTVVHDTLTGLGVIPNGSTQKLAENVTVYGADVFSRYVGAETVAEFLADGTESMALAAPTGDRLYSADYVDDLVDRLSAAKRREKDLKKQIVETTKKLNAIKLTNRWRVISRQRWLDDAAVLRLVIGSKQIRRTTSTPAAQIRSHYASELKRPVEHDLVLLESFYGRGLISNPYALFLAWANRPDFGGYRFVWALDDLASHEDLMARSQQRWPNVSFVQRGTNEYMSILARARYLINDVTFYFDFVKRPGQTYVNTWHSITVKSLGYDVPGNRLDQKNVVRNMLACDYFLAANDFVRDDMVLRSHMMEGIFPGRILVEGHPRNDLTFAADRGEVLTRMAAAGVELDPTKPSIVYAPTWRGKNINRPSDDLAMYEDVLVHLRRAVGDKYNVLIRLHQLTHTKLRLRNRLGRYAIPPTIDANEMFSAVDVLITDYSSIFFDFMVTNRPILFFMPDRAEYQQERGIYFTDTDLPGPVHSEVTALVADVEDLASMVDSYRSRYSAVKEWVCPKDDGHVSDRVLNVVLDGSSRRSAGSSPRKPRVLFYAGALAGGTRPTRLRNMVEQFGTDQFDLTVVVDDSRNAKVQWNVSYLLDRGVRVIGRSPHTVYTYPERVLLLADRTTKHLRLPRRLLRPLYEREWRRCFGDAQFDATVNLGFTSVFFARLLDAGNARFRAAWREPGLPTPENKESTLVDRVQRGTHEILDSVTDLHEFRQRLLAQVL